MAPALDGGEPVYCSDVVARPGEEATAIEHFAGRRLAVNEPGSHSGSNVVLATLAERGVPVGGFAEVVHTGSHAGSLAAVRAGEADVAAIDSHLLAALRADDLVVVERLGPSPSQPLAAGPALGGQERERVRATLAAPGRRRARPGVGARGRQHLRPDPRDAGGGAGPRGLLAHFQRAQLLRVVDRVARERAVGLDHVGAHLRAAAGSRRAR